MSSPLIRCGFPVAFRLPRACLKSVVMRANGDFLQSTKASSSQEGQCGRLQVPFENVILREIKIPELGSLWSDEIEVKSLPRKMEINFSCFRMPFLTVSFLCENSRHLENVRPRRALASQVLRGGMAFLRPGP